jgi:RNA polymerase sigma factor (sigma-70 family)
LFTGNNGKILEYLYQEIYPKIRSYIISNSGKADDALDIFQDSLVVLCRQIKAGKYDKQFALGGYLYTICRNLWINKVKKESRMKSLPDNLDVSEDFDFSEWIITHEKENVLREITLKLGEKCYDLLRHAIFHDSSTEEIIEHMGFSTANAVKTQKYKCKQKLYKILEENPKFREVIE